MTEPPTPNHLNPPIKRPVSAVLALAAWVLWNAVLLGITVTG